MRDERADDAAVMAGDEGGDATGDGWKSAPTDEQGNDRADSTSGVRVDNSRSLSGDDRRDKAMGRAARND